MIDENVVQIVKEKTPLVKPVKRIENHTFKTSVYYVNSFYKKISRYLIQK
jgi:hypothetical protein